LASARLEFETAFQRLATGVNLIPANNSEVATEQTSLVQFRHPS
jgi:hypothetical protein